MVSGEHIFDSAFKDACRAQQAAVVGTSYAGEMAFADALMNVSEILSDVLSSCLDRQQAARNRLDLLLSSEKESS